MKDCVFKSLLTAFAVDVRVQFPLQESLFDNSGCFVVRNVLERVCL